MSPLPAFLCVTPVFAVLLAAVVIESGRGVDRTSHGSPRPSVAATPVEHTTKPTASRSLSAGPRADRRASDNSAEELQRFTRDASVSVEPWDRTLATPLVQSPALDGYPTNYPTETLGWFAELAFEASRDPVGAVTAVPVPGALSTWLAAAVTPERSTTDAEADWQPVGLFTRSVEEPSAVRVPEPTAAALAAAATAGLCLARRRP